MCATNEEHTSRIHNLRVLVTGGAGFLVTHLCERLITGGNEVICLDNLFSSCKENIAHLLPNPKFEFVRHDMVLPYMAEVDQIYNMGNPTEFTMLELAGETAAPSQ